MNPLLVLGALGGVVAFLGSVWAVLRGIFKQIDATQDNTAAVNRLIERMDRADTRLNEHDVKIARLEGLGRRR